MCTRTLIMVSLEAPPLNFTPKEASSVQGVVRDEDRELIEGLCSLGIRLEVGLEYLLQFPAEDRVSCCLLLILGRHRHGFTPTADMGSPAGLGPGHDGVVATQLYRLIYSIFGTRIHMYNFIKDQGFKVCIRSKNRRTSLNEESDSP